VPLFFIHIKNKNLMSNIIIDPYKLTNTSKQAENYLLHNNLITYADYKNTASTALIFPDNININRHCNVAAPEKELLLVAPVDMYAGFEILPTSEGTHYLLDNIGNPTTKQSFYKVESFGDYVTGVQIKTPPTQLKIDVVRNVLKWAENMGIKGIYSIIAHKPFVYTKEYVLNYTYFTVKGLK
jgi:hypothetical protein